MIKDFETKRQKNKNPEYRSGYMVRVSQKIREGDKERIQVFEGVIINIGGTSQFNTTITVRKVVDGIGVEKIFPINSPNIAKIEVTKKLKVRRAKLFYLRGKEGQHIRLYEQAEHADAGKK